MYVLTNIEAEVTSKVLKNLGPSAGNELPAPERNVLLDLIERLSTDIENGLPEGPADIDNTLPTPPPTAGNELPEEPVPTPKA